MKHNLKLFIWKDVLTDYTPGIAFALAETEEEARDILLKQNDALGRDASFNNNKPEIYEDKMSYSMWGGG